MVAIQLFLISDAVVNGQLYHGVCCIASGGANVPALNDLLAPFGISYGDAIIHGGFTFEGGECCLQ